MSVVNITFSLPEHWAVVHLKNKNCKHLELPKVCQGGAGGLGKDILTSEIPLSLYDERVHVYIHLHEMDNASFRLVFVLLFTTSNCSRKMKLETH